MDYDQDCLFCNIVKGTEESVKVWENEEFLCIKNKYPKAPTHVLVMPKKHVKKQDVGVDGHDAIFWGKIMESVFEVINLLGLSKTGYKLVNNGAGYNHFEHEHIHVLGGSKDEPAGQT